MGGISREDRGPATQNGPQVHLLNQAPGSITAIMKTTATNTPGYCRAKLQDEKPMTRTIVRDDCYALRSSNPQYKGGDYEIDFERITTPEGLLGWVRLFCGKRFMDLASIEEFIDVIADHRGFKLPWH